MLAVSVKDMMKYQKAYYFLRMWYYLYRYITATTASLEGFMERLEVLPEKEVYNLSVARQPLKYEMK